MRMLLIIMLTALFLCSCSTGLNVRKSKIVYFNKEFTGTFDNNAYDVNGRRYGSPTLLGLFERYNEKADSVSILFDTSGRLELTFMDSLGTVKSEKFKGSFGKKGYYQVYLRNDKIEIPPVFPIIFGKHNINRVRLACTPEGNLIIDNQWNESGNIFLLGVGDNGRRQSFFSRKK
ncbi:MULTISPECIES: hypothetical protein [Niastella]|uniref:Lipoprotein n=1 Tax=Niastella soli TaxID=2821487 RepID=A0ABS3YWZ1_9BACT|nr:hypothetical protein [Niastella soli]MBO9202432.1 hypothetical protein [Niastella soli]